MDITELEAIEADMEAIGERWGLGQERVHDALRQAWADNIALAAILRDRDAFVDSLDERLTTAEAEVERQREWAVRLAADNQSLRDTIARVRALCEYVDIWDASEYDAGRMAALDAARAALDGEA